MRLAVWRGAPRPARSRALTQLGLGAGLASGLMLLCRHSGRTPLLPTMAMAQSRGLSSTSSMISCTEGRYKLRDQLGDTRQGGYRFDRDTQQLFDERGSPVGHFSAEPLQAEPLKARPSGVQDMPIIGIMNTEVMAEIQQPDNDGAYFVLPSQLNGAEYPSDDVVVEDVDHYRYDHTGGPRGQLAAHPAAAQFVLDNAACDGRPNGINAAKDIVSALSKAGFEFRVQNGYLAVPRGLERQGRQQQVVTLLEKSLHDLRPLVMRGVPASGLLPSHSGWSDRTHNVSLVYASAVPVQAYLNRGGRDELPVQREVASLVLMAQYLGALKAAAADEGSRSKARDRTRIFLMPLGGGVFNNDWSDIFAGMCKAVELLTPDEQKVLDIRVLTWSGKPQEREIALKFLRHHRKLRPEANL